MSSQEVGKFNRMRPQRKEIPPKISVPVHVYNYLEEVQVQVQCLHMAIHQQGQGVKKVQ